MTGERRRRWSLRLRITAGALVVVVAALAGAGLVLADAVEREMRGDVDSTLRANADFIDRTIRSGAALPTAEGPTDLYVQFIGADGQVLGASTAAEGRPALAEARDGASDRIVTVHDPVLGELLRALAMSSPTDPSTILVVARSASSVSRVRDSLVRVLVVMVVAGSVLLGLLIWVVVGRALRPVDDMRTTVAAISERDLDRRLDEPGTGDELDRLAGTLNDLLERLDVAVTREREFVADASHELRTPIAGVRTLLETEPADPATVIRVRAEALARLSQLQDLVEELLVLATADAASDVPTEPVDLDELVLLQARQLGRTTRLRIDTGNVSGGQVAGRDTELARVVDNLATNAARHAESVVAFSVQPIDGEVEFTVTDDGPGIAPADRGRIFERFSTLEDARPSSNGRAGLGLSIAHAIVTSYHGSIRAEDAPGSGAKFVVRLPRAATAVPVEPQT